MNETESHFQDWCICQCRIAGVLAYKTAALGRRGFPDLVIVGNGVVIFVELKSPRGTGKTALLQKRTLRRLQQQGAYVYVVDDRKVFSEILQSVCNGRANKVHHTPL